MAIGHVVTRGFGNGTFSGAIKEVVARGFIADSASDTTPDAFVFTDQTDVARSTLTLSNTITVTGIDAPAAISITGGEYKIDEGVFTSSPGSVTVGQQVQVRQTSSASYSTQTDTVLTIGGVSDTFSLTTLAAPALALVSAAIAADGDSISIVLSEAITFGAGGNGGFVLTPSGGASTATYSSGDTTDTLVYTLSRTIDYGETVTLAYTQPGDGVEASDDQQDLATFSGEAVTNSSSINGPLVPTIQKSAFGKHRIIT